MESTKNGQMMRNLIFFESDISKGFLSILILMVLMVTTSFSQPSADQSRQRTLPLGKSWFDDQNIDLPLPFGVSAFFTLMSRNIDISNVEVAFQDQPKQSINDFSSFDLNNKSTVAAVKVDAWLLPFVNVYGLLGYVSSNASLDATITIDRIVFPGPEIVIPIRNSSNIQGNYFGIGSTGVAGHKSWFILGDVNYGYSKLDEFNGKIDFWMFSTRTGFQTKINNNQLRTWIGGMYLSSNRTLQLRVENDILGSIEVDIYQQTQNPFTFQLGSSMSLSKHFEVVAELGTNFSDASLGVLTTSYRF